MNGRLIRSLVITVTLILAGGAWAQAQASNVKVGFDFVAAGKTLKAGNYSVDVAANGSVVLTAEQGGAVVEIPQARKISGRNFQKPQLVFDVVGSAKFLSEVRLPGKGAYQVGRQSGAQGQETVTGPKTEQ